MYSANHILLGIVCVLVIFIVCASGDYDTRGSEFLRENGGETGTQEGSDCVGNNCMKRTINGSPGAMWFGPRLGRRRRSGHKSVVNEEKRQITQFTPRLGRELEEDLLYGDLEDVPRLIDSQDLYDEERFRAKSSPLVTLKSLPSLQRSEEPLLTIPRLGRQLRQMLARM